MFSVFSPHDGALAPAVADPRMPMEANATFIYIIDETAFIV
jgi:hypothetical protein